VGYHETVLRIRQPIELHGRRNLPPGRPGCAAVTRLRPASVEHAGISAVRNWVVIVGHANLRLVAGGLGINAHAVDVMFHAAANWVGGNSRYGTPVDSIIRVAEHDVVGVAARFESAVRP